MKKINFLFVFSTCSPLFPFNSHFFTLCGVDGCETYRPENKTVIDIYSGWAIFHPSNVTKTLAKITNAARDVCDSWNVEYAKPEVYAAPTILDSTCVCVCVCVNR